MCGYHLRCLNSGNRCSQCKHQNKGKDSDYLHDILNVFSNGKEVEVTYRKR